MGKSEDNQTEEAWYATWFDTDYYHTLYRHRDDVEASAFVHRLIEQLGIARGAEVLDLACGKGRHAITLHEAGFDVVGLDLSANSIATLKASEKPGLQFEVWDMREPYTAKRFDYVFNLFTSFGYFDTMSDNLRVLRSIYHTLKPGGIAVIDYLNAGLFGAEREDEKQTIERDGLRFETHKRILEDKVVKSITVYDGDEIHQYKESVQLISSEQFRELFSKAGLRLANVFGDYDLSPYEPSSSHRSIWILEREA